MATFHLKDLITNQYLLTAYSTWKYLVIILTLSTNLFPFFANFYLRKGTLRTTILTAVSHFVYLSFAITPFTLLDF